MFPRAAPQGSRSGVFTLPTGQPPRNFSSLTSPQRRRMRWSALWERRKSQDQPTTKVPGFGSPQEESCPRRTRIQEPSDAVPGSQDSITRGIRHLQLVDVPAAQPDHADRPLLTMPDPRRPNYGLAIKERFCNVLSAARTHLPPSAFQIVASWFTWVKSMEESHCSRKV